MHENTNIGHCMAAVVKILLYYTQKNNMDTIQKTLTVLLICMTVVMNSNAQAISENITANNFERMSTSSGTDSSMSDQEVASSETRFSLVHKQTDLAFTKQSVRRRLGYDEPCARYRSIKNKVLGGGVISTIGLVVLSKSSAESNPNQISAGFGMLLAGSITQLVGIIVAVSGKIAYHHRCVFQMTSRGNSVGLAYHFNR
jgi:hypothetical protein